MSAKHISDSRPVAGPQLSFFIFFLRGAFVGCQKQEGEITSLTTVNRGLQKHHMCTSHKKHQSWFLRALSFLHMGDRVTSVPGRGKVELQSLSARQGVFLRILAAWRRRFK